MTYLLASDLDQVVMKAFELFNKDKIPHPATIIIDEEGIIQFRDVHENYRERTSVGGIVKVLEGLE